MFEQFCLKLTYVGGHRGTAYKRGSRYREARSTEAALSKEKSILECIGTSYDTLSGSIVCPFTLKTTGIYSTTFIICAKVFFCNPHFPVLATVRENLFGNM